MGRFFKICKVPCGEIEKPSEQSSQGTGKKVQNVWKCPMLMEISGFQLECMLSLKPSKSKSKTFSGIILAFHSSKGSCLVWISKDSSNEKLMDWRYFLFPASAWSSFIKHCLLVDGASCSVTYCINHWWITAIFTQIPLFWGTQM